VSNNQNDALPELERGSRAVHIADPADVIAAVLARNTLRYRRHAARLAELEAQLAELEGSGSAALAPSDRRTDLPG